MNRIVVLGCQRSGTNIVSACIAHDNGLPLFNERELNYSSCTLTNGSKDLLIEFMNNTPEFVLQAPSLNAYCEDINGWLDTPVTFYWVERNSDDIRQSRERVDWIGEDLEIDKYNERFDWFLENRYCFDSVDMAKHVFYGYQRHLIPVTITHYEAYKNHPLWKVERETLKIGEI